MYMTSPLGSLSIYNNSNFSRGDYATCTCGNAGLLAFYKGVHENADFACTIRKKGNP
jgi:hypothetical protein